MKNHTTQLTLPTGGHFAVADVTDELTDALAESGIRSGHMTICTSEPGCALIVNEKESGLIADIKEASARLGDGAASPLGSTSVMLPAIDGELGLGMWQRVLLVELGSEPSRTVVVQIVGE
ncbi:MAG TPA: hypothetical protein VIG64_08095 [Actinomycetota bacterium]|jgi:thiamine phosphate synthase YjbQ (UPF0047 family)